jgi:hypothetical protein
MNDLNRTLLTPGTEVQVANKKLTAIITAICIRGNNFENVEYEVAWWANGERKTTWIYDYEVNKKEEKVVGFAKSNIPVISN